MSGRLFTTQKTPLETNDPDVRVELDFELPWKLIFMKSW